MDRAPALIGARAALAIFAGGVAGALLRAGLTEALPPEPGQWPWATFLANLAGALLLGHVAARRLRSPHARPLLATGLCGALTTFATMQVELLVMLDEGRIGLAAGYATASVAAGLLAVLVATAHVRRRQAAAA